MNKLKKVLIAAFGACDIVFGIFTPIALSLISIRYFQLTGYNLYALMTLGIATSIFRAMKFFIFKNIED